MATASKHVEYTFDWKIRWEDYDQIGKALPNLRYYFVTSFKNVSFRWFTTLKPKDENIGFFISYADGPLDKISGVDYKIGVVKSDQSLGGIQATGIQSYLRAYSAWGWALEDKDSTVVRTTYGLKECDRLTYQVTIKIPIDTFEYCISKPAPSPCGAWSMKLFNTTINNNSNDEGASTWLSDTKIAGRDGIVINCHKVIVAAQSKALETIFEYPTSPKESVGEPAIDNDDQSVAPNPKKRKASAMMDDDDSTTGSGGIYDFPNLTACSLKSIMEYLYTGRVTPIADMTVTELIEMGDAGEQYDLKPLKEYCAAELWQRVIKDASSSAFEIARFADLHDEIKYLKHRALDVIAENYDRLGAKPTELAGRFGGTRGEELVEELIEYMGRRLRPKISS